MTSKKEVVDQIRTAVATVTSQREFLKWFKEEEVRDGLVLLNNSFIFRQKLQTNKNDLYLGIPVIGAHLGVSNVVVTRGIAFNSDFRFIGLKELKKREMQELNVTIDEQLKQLGRIVMVLIGEVLNNVVTRAPIGHSLFSELELNPSAPVGLAIRDKTIQVRSISDEEAIWDDLEKTYGNQLPPDLAQPLASALDHIRKNHYAVLRLPGDSVLSQPLLDSFVDALRQNLVRYKRAWNGCKGQADVDPNEFNDLLRIAYNFASDAVLVIRLLVSICDLKPIVRWCTVDEWFRLAESFRNLPWSKIKEKHSLDAYQLTVSNARNKAFHRLLPVDNTLRVDLDGTELGRITLRLFPEYAARNTEETLDYDDRVLVELLTNFTRVSKRSVSPQFWRRNITVMEATVELLSRTSSTLKLLAMAQSHTSTS